MGTLSLLLVWGLVVYVDGGRRQHGAGVVLGMPAVVMTIPGATGSWVVVVMMAASMISLTVIRQPRPLATVRTALQWLPRASLSSAVGLPSPHPLSTASLRTTRSAPSPRTP